VHAECDLLTGRAAVVNLVLQTGLVQGLLQNLQRRELGLPPDAGQPSSTAGHAAASAGGSRPSTSSSTGSGRTQHPTAGNAQAPVGATPPHNHGDDAAYWPASRAAGRAAVTAAAAAHLEGAGRPGSARPQSSSRPHTASSGSSSRVATPQQQRHQQQRLVPPVVQQPQQQYRLVQASEVFQVSFCRICRVQVLE
jgi:hypothetical protein